MTNVWLLTEEQKNIDMYLQAAVNLYGHISPRQFLLIYNRYNKNEMPKLLKDKLMQYSNKLNRQSKNYHVYSDAIINTTVSKEAIFSVIFDQRNKKYYIPVKEDFLKWTNELYCPVTPQSESLCNFLITKAKISPEIVQASLPKVFHSILIGERMQAQIDIFESYGIILNENSINKFYDYFAEFLNNSRRWANCGFMPYEICKTYKR